MARRARRVRETGPSLCANTNYAVRFLGILIRAFVLARKNLPGQSGINRRGVFYGRNGAMGPLDSRNSNLTVWEYQLGQEAHGRLGSRVL